VNPFALETEEEIEAAYAALPNWRAAAEEDELAAKSPKGRR